MASTDTWAYNNITTTGSSGGYYTGTTTGVGYVYSQPMTITSSGAGGYSAPRPKTALEWLDDETEAVCKLARVS